MHVLKRVSKEEEEEARVGKSEFQAINYWTHIYYGMYVYTAGAEEKKNKVIGAIYLFRVCS